MTPCPRSKSAICIRGLSNCPACRSYALVLSLVIAGATGYYLLVVQSTSNKENKSKDPHMFRVVFVLGGPGSGKGTQCEKLTQANTAIRHLSAGDLLRAERKKTGSKLADIINYKIDKGELVPSEITVQLIQNAMHQHYTKNGCSHFVIDGFPRSFENLEAWNKVMDSNKVKVEFVLYLDCPQSVMTKRLLKRGETSGRSDDNEEIIKKRFETAQKETMPIVEHYEKQPGMLKNISADQTVEEVFAKVAALFEGFC